MKRLNEMRAGRGCLKSSIDIKFIRGIVVGLDLLPQGKSMAINLLRYEIMIKGDYLLTDKSPM